MRTFFKAKLDDCLVLKCAAHNFSWLYEILPIKVYRKWRNYLKFQGNAVFFMCYAKTIAARSVVCLYVAYFTYMVCIHKLFYYSLLTLLQMIWASHSSLIERNKILHIARLVGESVCLLTYYLGFKFKECTQNRVLHMLFSIDQSSLNFSKHILTRALMLEDTQNK